jgi:hypothetical protein
MLKGVDVLLALGLLRHPAGGWTVRSLAEELKLPPASVQRSLERLAATPVLDGHRRRVNVAACERLLTDTLPFVVPVTLGGETRGLPTAWAAPPLADQLAEAGQPPVWPDPHGEVRGLSVAPLHPGVVALARADSEMHELLALVDGIRLGDARVRGLAGELLRERIHPTPQARRESRRSSFPGSTRS